MGTAILRWKGSSSTAVPTIRATGSYLLVKTPLRLAWWLAAVVFAEVLYFKVVVLDDPTLVGGDSGWRTEWGGRAMGEGYGGWGRL
jgi:hypothetical protein